MNIFHLLINLLLLSEVIKSINIQFGETNLIKNINFARRNILFKTIIFKEKTIPKILKKVVNPIFDKYYYMIHSRLGLLVSDYNSLSEDDKIIIETILSLYY